MRRIKCTGQSLAGATYIELDNVKVPVENLIGEEGKGMRMVMTSPFFSVACCAFDSRARLQPRAHADRCADLSGSPDCGCLRLRVLHGARSVRQEAHGPASRSTSFGQMRGERRLVGVPRD
jgi:hypothetical protein